MTKYVILGALVDEQGKPVSAFYVCRVPGSVLACMAVGWLEIISGRRKRFVFESEDEFESDLERFGGVSNMFRS